MRFFLLLLLSSLLSHNAFAQKGLKETIVPLLQSNQLTRAGLLLDSATAADPKNVDAWMLKGNLEYFKFNNNLDLLALTPNNNESIYDESMGSIGPYTPVVPIAVADSCIFYLSKALSIDSTRGDIHAGICYILSISIQPEKLIAYIPTLMRHSPISPAGLRDYAYNMIDRGHLTEGMKVFEAICNIDPEDANILSDMSAEYYYQGDMENAKKTITNALTRKHADDMTWGNAFFLFSVIEEQGKAAYAAKVQSDLKDDNNYLLYDAMISLYAGKPEWRTKMGVFITKPSIDDHLKNFAEFLLNDSLRDEKATYDSILHLGVNDGYMMLVYHYLFNKYPHSFYSAFSFAEVLTHTFRYDDAIKVFKSIRQLPADTADAEAYHFYYAWDLYKTKQYDVANLHWQQLIQSKNFYYKSAACYFLGKFYKEAGDKKKAKYYLEMVSNRASDSKYANFSAAMLKWL